MAEYVLDAQKFPLHDTAVKSALGEFRKSVHEIPLGSNTGPDVIKYQRATFLGGTNWAWCVAFYQWNWAHEDHPLPYKGAGAYDLLSWAGRAGWLTHTPIPGDGVCWNVGSGHWSMFLRNEGSYVVTVDGNVSDSVKICKRPASLVRGYMHIPEVPHVSKPSNTIAPVALKLQKVKKYQIVSSASGHRQLVVSGRPLKLLTPFISKSLRKRKRITIEEVK